jgi:hypothetical protein
MWAAPNPRPSQSGASGPGYSAGAPPAIASRSPSAETA